MVPGKYTSTTSSTSAGPFGRPATGLSAARSEATHSDSRRPQKLSKGTGSSTRSNRHIQYRTAGAGSFVPPCCSTCGRSASPPARADGQSQTPLSGRCAARTTAAQPARGSLGGQSDQGGYPPGNAVFRSRRSGNRLSFSSRYIRQAIPCWRSWFRQAVRWANRRARCSAGNRSAARIPTTATTVRSSSRVKPRGGPLRPRRWPPTACEPAADRGARAVYEPVRSCDGRRFLTTFSIPGRARAAMGPDPLPARPGALTLAQAREGRQWTRVFPTGTRGRSWSKLETWHWNCSTRF